MPVNNQQIGDILNFLPEFHAPNHPILDKLGKGFFRAFNLSEIIDHNGNLLENVWYQLEDSVQQATQTYDFEDLPDEIKEKQKLMEGIDYYLDKSRIEYSEAYEAMNEEMQRFVSAVIQSGDPTMNGVSIDFFDNAQDAVEDMLEIEEALIIKDSQMIAYLSSVLSD